MTYQEALNAAQLTAHTTRPRRMTDRAGRTRWYRTGYLVAPQGLRGPASWHRTPQGALRAYLARVWDWFAPPALLIWRINPQSSLAPVPAEDPPLPQA